MESGDALGKARVRSYAAWRPHLLEVDGAQVLPRSCSPRPSPTYRAVGARTSTTALMSATGGVNVEGGASKEAHAPAKPIAADQAAVRAGRTVGVTASTTATATPAPIAP